MHLQRTPGNQAVQRFSRAKDDGFEMDSGAIATARFAHDFSQIPVYAKSPAAIQTKLMVNAPGDAYEQEADRVAERVMRMSEPQVQRACDCGGRCPKCQAAQPGQEHEHLQVRRVQASDAGQTTAPPVLHEVLRSPGRPLDPATLAFMEPRFGHDFSQVRVHTDAQAADSARAVNALAYTVGQDLIFGAGHYAPSTNEGSRLLAHELTHTLQQREAPAITVHTKPDPAQSDTADTAEEPLATGCPYTAEFVQWNLDASGCPDKGPYGMMRQAKYEIKGGPLDTVKGKVTEQFPPDKIELSPANHPIKRTTSDFPLLGRQFDDCYGFVSDKELPSDFRYKLIQNHIFKGTPIDEVKITFKPGTIEGVSAVSACLHPRKKDSCDFDSSNCKKAAG